ncbi:rho GTPase-activating protein 20-like [Choloepus didactylus]|uniref:rho GTPase-activating protein 20-like n=1 Tax=Choloepus didactylus TaxID=27675 RepID=UPI00189FF7FF|nr:rho GTPase-activating protein 20-like [Choloepus didactylus]
MTSDPGNCGILRVQDLFAVLCQELQSSSTDVDTDNEKTTSFEGPIRTLLIHGPVELKRGWRRQKRHLFLFSDLLLVSNSKYRKNFKIKMKIPLSTIWMADCVDEVGGGDRRAKRSFMLGWPTLNFKASFSSPEQKDQWYSFLQRYISLAKEKDQPKSIPLKIVTKDIMNSACVSSITATNTDTTNDIINKSLPMLGITGSEKDYQMWVSLDKKEAPYPLTGHEHPYEIEMSHLRATELLPQGSRVSTSPSTFQGSFPLEQGFSSRETQVQFILKPRHPARSQHPKVSDQKTVRRRPSFINWAFLRGSGTPQDKLCKDSSTPSPRHLFGASLTDICENDNLPTALLDMIFFINQKGLLSEGIFRISASVQACRALKEKLNSEVKVDLDSESVFVVTSVLKDFLRNIQGSVFVANLYDKWLDVIDQGNEEERITAIQRLSDQLPRANLVLLRYLFGLLHNIEQHSSSNQMTAYNLAVCIAPSLLWPLTSGSPELGSQLTKEVSLVQFLIENCIRIFGEDITSLLEENSMSCENKEKTSAVTVDQPLESKMEEIIVIHEKAQLQDYDKVSCDIGPPSSPTSLQVTED